MPASEEKVGVESGFSYNPETKEQVSVVRDPKDGSIVTTKILADGSRVINRTDRFGNPISREPVVSQAQAGKDGGFDARQGLGIGISLLPILGGALGEDRSMEEGVYHHDD